MTTLSEATHIEVEAGVRYWDDATVNGIDEDNESPVIPLKRGDAWCPRIRLADGVVEGWPAGTAATTHYKVCDDGLYWLTDADGKRLAKWGGCYVPDEILCPADNGYGDYIIMTIGEDGQIEHWVTPTINPDDWEAL